jgi:hypothetical protein
MVVAVTGEYVISFLSNQEIASSAGIAWKLRSKL